MSSYLPRSSCIYFPLGPRIVVDVEATGPRRMFVFGFVRPSHLISPISSRQYLVIWQQVRLFYMPRRSCSGMTR